MLAALIVLLFSTGLVTAQERDGGIPISDNFTSGGNASPASAPKNWYEKFAIRGYAQLRYNRLLETNPDLGCEQCDKSWGEGGGFFLRRVRVIFFGQISPRVYFYIQPDFASSTGNTLNIGQIRDAYFDVGLDKKNEFRVRIGQSKIPYGFENMQSSSNRLPLDRADGTNSALKNERDAGVMFYWAPAKVRSMFSMFNRTGLKGSGDYGVFGFGVFNGQTANSPELNNSPHVVSRLSYPFQIGSQIIEPGIQAYTGMYEIPTGNLSKGVKYKQDLNYLDQRVAGSFVLYPQPFGIQAEYNIGRGPEFNKATDSIEVKSLTGGYATLSYMIKAKNMLIYPFTRIQYYEGGKKHEKDARSYKVNELELGIEWLPVKEFELVVMYTISSRKYEDFILRNNFQQGNLLRIQAQLNFR
ncbi:MAG: hypothetical protein KDC11_04815 [Chitinophagaceae bacterium]|nr:hypothetical protein [Chitinophagaceae bacterium]